MPVPHPTNMTRTCPDCGTAMDYDARTAYVLRGTCGQCGHAHTILQDGPVPGATPDGGPSGPLAEGIDPARGASIRSAPIPAPNGPECDACGSSLTFRASSAHGIEATCSGCGAISSFVPAGAPGADFRRGRPNRPEAPPEMGRGFSSPQARPCRECGGPLRFTTTPDGTVAGECGSCGNRFVLPPRRDSDGGRGGGGARRFDRGSGPRFGGRGGSRPYGRPPGGRFRPREDRGGDGEDERPRRRPRRE
jgi:hypothetical protein